MPMKLSRYPVNWRAVARAIKAACDGECQECGAEDTERTITVAHVYPASHAPDAEFVCVQVLCDRCHLRFDAAHAARRTRLHYRRFHMALPTAWARRMVSDLSFEDLAELETQWPSLDELFAEVQAL